MDMIQVPREVQERFEEALESGPIRCESRPAFRKWLRYYWDFCGKYGHSPDSETSVSRFTAKLASKHQDEARRRQVAEAVEVYLGSAVGAAGWFRNKQRVGEGGSGFEAGTTCEEDAESSAGRGGCEEALLREEASRQQATMDSGRGSSWVAQYEGLEGAIRMRNYSPTTRKKPIPMSKCQLDC